MKEKIKIHFIHGSMPKGKKSQKSKRLMGILGGHVLLQIDSKIFSFTYKNKNISLFRSKVPNGIFKKETFKDWNEKVSWEKRTEIQFDLDPSKLFYLSNLLEIYCNNSPYDYVVFGERCCSVNYNLLIKIGIIKESIIIRTLANIPFLYRWAIIKKLDKISNGEVVFKGCNSRIWL